jgi:hypothetical protein
MMEWWKGERRKNGIVEGWKDGIVKETGNWKLE